MTHLDGLETNRKMSTATLYFFGDSWSSENCEIEKLAAKKQIIVDQPIKSYPVMVGEIMGLPVKNFSRGASSQASLIQQILESDISAGDHAIFSLTAPSRRMYYDSNGQSKNLFVTNTKEALNDHDDSWQSALICYTLYKLCQDKSVRCWFLSTFNVSYDHECHHDLWHYIPDSLWLVPKEKCVVQTELDPGYFSRYQCYKNSDFYEWLHTDNDRVKKYIRPCKEHPNLYGRRLIADKISLELENRIS